MAESFWKIPNVDNIEVPLMLMREQASELTRQTGGSLRGSVQTQKLGDELYLSFQIVVPALDGYSIELFTYEQPLQIYPGVLSSNLHKQRYRVGDLSQFKSLLKHVLASDETERMLTGPSKIALDPVGRNKRSVSATHCAGPCKQRRNALRLLRPTNLGRNVETGPRPKQYIVQCSQYECRVVWAHRWFVQPLWRAPRIVL
jgi:hypothetical protein